MKRGLLDYLMLNWELVMVVLFFLLILVLTLLSGCQTAQAVADLGPDFWISLENLIVAVGKDLWSIIDLVL